MRRSKCSVLVGALVLVVAASARQPTQQLDIDFTVRKTGSFRPMPNEPARVQVTLSGVLACSGGTTSNSEHLDLFLTLSRGTTVISQGSEAYDHCQNAPKVWTATWLVVVPPGTDLAAPLDVDITACTNPGAAIDEDCETAHQTVKLQPAA